MKLNSKNFGHISEIDGMRGIAILAVMIFHADPPSFQGGFIGVDIFFVISGFLITSLIINEYDFYSSVNLKNFYIRRLLRLGPALVLLLLTFTLLSALLLDKDKVQSNYIDSIIALFYMTNWVRALTPPPHTSYLSHTWSLSIEEQFYILWPITLLTLLRVFTNRWLVTFIVFFIALSAWLIRIYLLDNGASIMRIYCGLDTRADALMIGCALGVILSSDLLNDRKQIFLSKWLSVLTPCSIIFLVIISFTMRYTNPSMYYWGFLAIEIFTAIILLHLFVNKAGFTHKLLSMKWIVWVGSISYGLYLWHFPIYRAIKDLHYSKYEVIIYGTLLTFIISILSRYLLEKPMLKLKKKFTP